MLCVIAAIAFLPVSTMTNALKNDILSLEYPIKFFMSDAIHNGVSPLWFSTWAMGFPLESIITWSIFSPPGFFIAALTKYNLYTLHIEFILYIALAGCSIYYLLKKHFVQDNRNSFLLAVGYMLSGFCVGSSQWLLYITAAAYIPICLCVLLSLLSKPALKTAFLFSVAYYIMLTSVYLAFSIIASYVFLMITIYKLFRFKKDAIHIQRILKFAGLSALFIAVLSFPCLYSSIQLLTYIERGDPIVNNKDFFQSNFLHPYGLLSLIGPLACIKPQVAGTEATMMNTYMGLSVILFFPAAVMKISNTNRKSFFLLLVALFFLLLSLGHLTPVRDVVNILPGFSYFRNAGLFRFFFILFLTLFLGQTNYLTFNEDRERKKRKAVTITALFISLLLVFLLTKHVHSLNSLPFSIAAAISSITKENSLALTALIQLPLLWFLYFAWRRGKRGLVSFAIVTDLIINTFICLPFFTVSNYSVKEVSNILKINPRYPVQSEPISTVATTYRLGNAIWFNTNVFQKRISIQSSYWGPLMLKTFMSADTSVTSQGPFLYDTFSANMKIITQKPDYLLAKLQIEGPTEIYFLQNWYPGWNAYINGEKIKIHSSEKLGMKVIVNQSGKVVFKYKKEWLSVIALIINVIVILTALYVLLSKLRKSKIIWKV
jgi:hypothetical protein